MTHDEAAAGDEAHQPRWQPIRAIDRRVLGVLVEKAKTTPDTYPLSLNGLVTGCNQKNNRHPLTQYEPHEVEESLDRLRLLGAVAAVQGSGRVGKYRHYMYEWLGVDKVELAIMAELLLRGAQTEGDLRGRAARMDPIPDLTTLRTLLDSLKAKGLIQALTPEGRGQIISHALYLPEEVEKLKRQYGEHGGDGAPRPVQAAQAPVAAAAPRPAAVSSAPPVQNGEIAALRQEIADLRTAVAQLRSDLADVVGQSQQNADQIGELRQALGG
ncbi:MAG TPA: DUF480 domain-containing protein [Pirellulales bacterium]|nr:DUF480 domain-containing protein [Pirellulales bacterium]